MQTPSAKTSVSKCLELAGYCGQMLGKFPNNPTLTAVAAKMASAAKPLNDAQANYAAAVIAILPTRVDVKFENFVSDRRIRLTQQKAEIADGSKGGPIMTQAFPDGSAPITRLLGMSQVNAMADLVGRLVALAPLWPDANAESQAIEQHRDNYKKALDGRTSAGQTATNLKAKRDVAKESFLTVYVELTHLVAAEFPRDTVMRIFFFDDVRSASSAAAADDTNADPGADATTPVTP